MCIVTKIVLAQLRLTDWQSIMSGISHTFPKGIYLSQYIRVPRFGLDTEWYSFPPLFDREKERRREAGCMPIVMGKTLVILIELQAEDDVHCKPSSLEL